MSAPKKPLDDAISRIYEAQAVIAVVGFAVAHESNLGAEDVRSRISNALSGAESLLESAGTMVGKISGVYS